MSPPDGHRSVYPNFQFEKDGHADLVYMSKVVKFALGMNLPPGHIEGMCPSRLMLV